MKEKRSMFGKKAKSRRSNKEPEKKSSALEERRVGSSKV
jgi:hypothetical protein